MTSPERRGKIQSMDRDQTHYGSALGDVDPQKSVDGLKAGNSLMAGMPTLGSIQYERAERKPVSPKDRSQVSTTPIDCHW